MLILSNRYKNAYRIATSPGGNLLNDDLHLSLHMQAPLFLQKLRSATSASHRALEENPASKILMSPNVTLHAVDVYLKRMYGFVKEFEQIVFPILENSLPQLNERRKTRLLEADLKISAHERKNLPLFPLNVLTTHYHSLAKAWGGMYVLEGSTLGGQLISKHLQSALGEVVATKLHYFTPYGPQTGAMWKNFLHYFSEAAIDESYENEIIDSAVQTFSLLDSWLTSTISKFLNNAHSKSN
jgi:heme oxygenase (biliverdin-IX-beta and delta-forming)